MVAESWFRGFLKNSRKHGDGSETKLVGVLSFEVSSLMSKLIHLWRSLGDKQVVRMREEIMNSVGIRKLVSDDDEYIVSLMCAEMIKNVEHVARAVSRLAKKCSDTYLKSFEQTFEDLIKNGADPYEWLYTWKKMDKKVKKMERFIMLNANLHQEVETLAELEQILSRAKSNGDTDNVNFIRNEKAVVWKKHEVKHLKEISLWNRTYDYIVRLLARSLFTIVSRIGHVFGFNHVINAEITDSKTLDSDYIYRSQSLSVLLQSSSHPSENNISRYSSGPLEKIPTASGPNSRKSRANNFYSGPLVNSITASSPISGKHKSMSSYSGPLGRSTTKSVPLPKSGKSVLKLWKNRDNTSKPNKFATAGPFKGCMIGENNSPVKNCYLKSNDTYTRTLVGVKDTGAEAHACPDLLRGDLSIISSNSKMLNAPPDTLGAAALALHYANVIIVIEKLAASPHLIGHDARDDLYNMLPASVRAALRVKLKPFTKTLNSSVYDTTLAKEWNDAILGILEWLAPLAHNMIRWQSERSFEHQNLLSKTNVLLVQTLFYANQEKTEATITELLIGLNYIWRYGREVNTKAILECESGRTFDDSLAVED